MIRLPRLNTRQWLIVTYDLLVMAAAVVVKLAVRFEDTRLSSYLTDIPKWLPVFVAYAAVIYVLFGLYKAKWRFAATRSRSENWIAG